MSDKTGLGILGCGDYLRWQTEDLLKSKEVVIKSLFDLDKSRAEAFAEKLGGVAVDTPVIK